MRRYLQPSATMGPVPKPKLSATEHGGLDHIEAGLQPAVRLQAHLVAHVLCTQYLVRFGQDRVPTGYRHT